MKILVNTPILNIDGTELLDENNKPLLLADALIKAMLTPIDEDKNLADTDKLKLWKTAEKIQDARGNTLELTIDDAAFIKNRVNKVFLTAIVIGNVDKIFEAAATK